MTNTLKLGAVLTRRQAIKRVALATAAMSASSLPAPAVQASRTIKIGFVTPKTGPLAIFAEPDGFVLEQVRKATSGGLKINGSMYAVEVVVKDSQSNPNRAADVAKQLISRDEVHLITAASTPETTNPVASQAEANEVPCLTTDTPWQPHFFGRGGDPKVGFDWTYHFFWGLEDIVGVFTGLWEKVPTNRVIGALWPNDSDGNAWGDPKLGFPPALSEKHFSLVDPGRFQGMTDDFSAQIAAFKKANVEIVTGVVVPPDFTTFWTQAAQQGFKPKIVSVGKALEFPQAIQALGNRGNGLSVEVWWSPNHPFKSGLTGQTSAELAAEYEKATGRPWTMPLAFKHSLFEVALNALQRTEDPASAKSIRDALKTTNYESVVGRIDFSKGPVPNIAKTPLVGGQWQKQKDDTYKLLTVENARHPNIPLTGEMVAIG